VAARMVDDLAACVTERLSASASPSAPAAPAPEQKPIRGLSLALRVLWGRVKKVFSRR
jgi:hypothetical protein